VYEFLLNDLVDDVSGLDFSEFDLIKFCSALVVSLDVHLILFAFTLSGSIVCRLINHYICTHLLISDFYFYSSFKLLNLANRLLFKKQENSWIEKGILKAE